MAPVFVTGGTGFVGRNLLQAMGDRPVRLLIRPGRMPTGIGENVEIVVGDVTQPGTLAGQLEGCSAVVHLVAIIEEKGDATFDGVIRQGTENVVAAARQAGVPRFLQMSALGTRSDPAYPYFDAKAGAEQAVKSSGLDWTILRPAIIFGPGDEFMTKLADLVRRAPVVPVVGAGMSEFQPVHITDVADAIAYLIDDENSIGQLYDLAGPEVFTYEQLLKIIARQLGKDKKMVHLPVSLMRTVVKASRPLPESLRPPVTLAQLKMLEIDNSTSQSATEALTGRPPKRLQENLDYLQ